MKRFAVLLTILISAHAMAQDSLQSLNYTRTHTTLTGMKVLGIWGAVNMGVGAVGWAKSEGESHKYFYQMNTFWGVTNAGIGLLSYLGNKRNSGKQLTADESLKAQHSIEKIFLINGGLDFVYIGTGILLNVRGNNKNNAQLKGYGSSLIMQGAFLLLFDGAMYNAHRTNGNKLRNFLEKNTIIFNGNSIGLVYNF